MPIGNPQDILTTPYGYSGQVAPETAVRLQNLNRRRLIANMLMQQGMQPTQGQMVGRFYVPPSLAQGFAGLGSTLAGALLAGDIDKKSSQAVDDDRKMVLEALEAYRTRQNQGGPPPQPPAPPPDQNFNGQVGATPMPDLGVQSAQPPIPAQRPASTAGDIRMQGLDMENVQPADMSAMANSANPDMAHAQAATAQTIPQVDPSAAPIQPSPAPAPVQPEQGAKPAYDQLASLMTHQHPQVRAYGQFLAQMQQREQERGDTQAFNREQRDLDREVRREGIEANALSRAEMIRGNMINTQAQIEARLQAGRDASDLKAELARQQADLKKTEIQSRAETAKQHDETLKAIAAMNVEGRKDVAGLKAGAGKPLPSSAAQKFIDNSSNLRMAERALDLISGREVDGVKGDPNATGMKGFLPDSILQRTDPQGVETRAAIANLGSMVIHDRSGAAVTAAEFPRLRPFIPTHTDDPATVKKKLSQFVSEYRKVVDEMSDFYSEAGYTVPKNFHKTPSDATPQAGGAVLDALPQGAAQIGTSGGKPVYQLPDGRKVIGE